VVAAVVVVAGGPMAGAVAVAVAVATRGGW